MRDERHLSIDAGVLFDSADINGAVLVFTGQTVNGKYHRIKVKLDRYDVLNLHRHVVKAAGEIRDSLAGQWRSFNAIAPEKKAGEP